jgi:hypothetical protein
MGQGTPRIDAIRYIGVTEQAYYRWKRNNIMTGLDYFAWAVLIILLVTIVAFWIILAMLPGKIARQREHPQADAINVSGWLGALAMGIFWPLALIWAFSKSGNKPQESGEIERLHTRLAELEGALSSQEANPS